MSRWFSLLCKVGLLLSGLVVGEQSWALACKELGSGTAQIIGSLGTTLPLAATTPDGTVVWQSPNINIEVECRKDHKYIDPEPVFLYVNPAAVSIGQGIRAGIRYNGVGYLQSSGRILTPATVPRCTTMNHLDRCGKTTFTLAFSVFIEKYGPVPDSGNASDLVTYNVLQVDGANGVNPSPGTNLVYAINDMRNIRFIACQGSFQVLPAALDFGSLELRRQAKGQLLASRRFSLLVNRTCNAPIEVVARLSAGTGTIQDDLLVPAGNQAVGIRLRAQISRTLAPFEKYFLLTNMTGTSSLRADFDAELVWRDDKPQPGAFEAELIIDAFYR